MKVIVLVFGILNIMVISSKSYGQSTMSDKEIKLMCDNNIGRFVRKAGSEENAIDKLMEFNLPDTFYNRANKNMIWHIKTPQKLIELDYYSSRKMQTLYWILKIFYSDYDKRKNKNEFCIFMNDSGKTIWDYKDLDIAKKAYFYQVIITSPVEHKTYYNDLGYKRLDCNPYQELESAFINWYNELKNNSLQYMRENKIQPVKSSNYEIIIYETSSRTRLKKKR